MAPAPLSGVRVLAVEQLMAMPFGTQLLSDLGAEVIASGKLAAKGAKKRAIKVRLGYMPKAGDTMKLVDEAAVAAYPKYGAIGIKVRIVQPGTVFPDRAVKQVELPKSIAAAK